MAERPLISYSHGCLTRESIKNRFIRDLSTAGGKNRTRDPLNDPFRQIAISVHC